MPDDTPPPARQPALDNWRYRRRAVFGFLLFSGAIVGYLAVRGQADGLREEIASALTYGSVAVILGYVFGAVADDWKRPK